jgi:hypothetical protein
MAYAPSLGIRARKVGENASHMATAPRRARLTARWLPAGRMGNSAATDASSASVRDASSKKAFARTRGFMCAVARYDSTATLNRINSADGGGRSSVGDAEISGTSTIRANGCEREINIKCESRGAFTRSGRHADLPQIRRNAVRICHSILPAPEFPDLTRPAEVGFVAAGLRHLVQRRGRGCCVSIRETNKPCKARPAMLPNIPAKLPGFGSGADRLFDLRHVHVPTSLQVQQ